MVTCKESLRKKARFADKAAASVAASVPEEGADAAAAVAVSARGTSVVLSCRMADSAAQQASSAAVCQTDAAVSAGAA